MNNLVNEFKIAWKKPDNYVFKLIAINVIVFVLYQTLKLIEFFAVSPDTLTYFFKQVFLLPSEWLEFIYRPWTLIGYFFTHQDFFHILFNVLFIYWFGRILADLVHGRRVLAVYVLGGLAGGLTFLLMYNLIPVYQGRNTYLLGASAGAYAIVVAAATLRPDYKMFLIFLGPVKIKYIALFSVLISFFGTSGSNAGGNLAHLGGALMGFIFVHELKKGRDLGGFIFKTLFFFQNIFRFRKPFRPKFKIVKTAKTKPPTANKKRDFSFYEAEIDLILDKISEHGYSKLTEKEKSILMDRSRQQNSH